jgi:ABC-type polysaccharide/polyol phosphate transport system ATPase subunit
MRTDVRSEPHAPPDILQTAGLAVSVEQAFKVFRIPHQQYSTLKERTLHPFRSHTYDELHALNNVSLSVGEGEFFGIVGRNGSGKSTLLKCLAGIYPLDGGAINVQGRLSPFIELGVGFNPDLAARDNVLINAVMMGLSRAEARRRFDDIIAFAELEDFVDLKLKNYSSGMAVRLGFAVSTQVDADVLLIDEVLAVGDASFQQKCFEVFQRLKDEGKTILLVTHDMSLVERFCDRALLLERGEVLETGDPHHIGLLYNQVNFGDPIHERPDPDGPSYGRPVEIRFCWFEVDGQPVNELPHGESLEIAYDVRFNEPIDDPVFGLSLRNDVGHTVFATTTQLSEPRMGSFEPGEEITVRVRVRAWFGPSRYRATPSVASRGTGAKALDLREDMASFILHSTRSTGGVIDPPHSFEIERKEVRAG